MKVELLSITPDAEKLIELAARTAYNSQDKITEKSHETFIKSLVSRGHLSTIEHASATFLISGVSRNLTHQMVRHRLASFTQESFRYVTKNKEIKKLTPWSKFTEEEEKDILYLYNGGRTTNELSKICSCSQDTISNIIIRNGGIIRDKGNYCISNINLNLFNPNTITSLESQLLGLIFADGCIFYDEKSNSYRIIIKMKDEDYMRQISYIFGCNLIKTSDNLFSTTICSKKIYDTLVNIYGLTPNKSLTLSSKLLEKNLPKNMIPHFIRGFLEGDGSILWYPERYQKSIVFTSGSKEFLEWLDYILNLECNSTKRNKIKKVSCIGTAYQLSYSNIEDITKIINYIYNDFNFDLCLHRKLLVAAGLCDIKKYIENASNDFSNKYEIITPPSISNNLEVLCSFTIPIQMSIFFYKNFEKIIPKEDLRYALPSAMKTELVMTANFREWRHIIQLRTDKAAQWEIRELCQEILKILKEKAPSCFGDL